MLDEPTNDTPPTDVSDGATEQPKPVRRRRATKAPADAAAIDDAAATDDAPADDAPAAPAKPAKRVRKAPAKKAAPRKRTAKAAAGPPDPAAGPPDPAAGPPDPAAADPATGDPTGLGEQTPLTEEELAAQAAALLAVQAPAVVAAVEDDPVVQGNAADDVTTAALDAPVKRTRTRRPAVVTFQAPELRAPELPASEPGGEAPGTHGDGDIAAPRRRRRAGTAAAGAPGALELIEPVRQAPSSRTAAPQPSTDDSAADDSAADDSAADDSAVDTRASADPGSGPDTGFDSDDDEDGDRPRRRRRGRRGRGPRRPEDEGDEASAADEEASGETGRAQAPPEGAPPAETDDDEDSPTGTRRRRRRRRSGGSGEDGAAAEDPPSPPAAREPRAPRNRGGSGATAADDDGVRGITGSTRMAAKRVRRQEGRDSGRKRTPILSEAEFLSRREAVDRTMIVRQRGDRTQIAVLEDGVLVEHYVTRASAQSYAGNVYLGRVQNVLPSMEAAFVDIGKSRNAVLYAGEVNYDASVGGRSRSIESVLKSGQEVLVQVSKDPIGAKGSRLTGQVSLPGRYLVYVPEGSMTGISRKLPEAERARLKAILKQIVPDEAGVIIRTAAEGASEQEIAADVRRLQAQWEVIQSKAAKGGAPVLLHAEPDLVIRVVRDVFNEDFTSLVVSGDSEWHTIKEYVDFVAPDLAPRLSRHASERDVFAEHRVDEQLLKALDRKVYLPSGGSLVIDRTEAMVVVDVNTGKYVGKGGNLEETVTRNNLEAAEEIARQLRLRDLGGIIVVDFIDMVLESNRDLVVRRLVECLGRDRTKHQVAEVTSLGLVQMTRKRVGQGLLESFSEPCEACSGRGVHVYSEPVDERHAGGGAGGGGGSGGDRPKVRQSRPLPPDAPKPGAAISAAAVAVADPAEPAVDADAAPTPKRRRRGGRSTGAATVPASEELAELLSATADAEVVSVAAADPSSPEEVMTNDALPDDVVADAVLDEPAPDEPAPDEPAPDEPAPDEPAPEEPALDEAAPDRALDAGVLPDDVRPAQPPPGWAPPPAWSAFSADNPLGGIIAPVEPQPGGEASPRRRRRATSTPDDPAV